MSDEEIEKLILQCQEWEVAQDLYRKMKTTPSEEVLHHMADIMYPNGNGEINCGGYIRKNKSSNQNK